MEYNKRTNILFVDDMSECCRIFMKGLDGKYEMYWAQNKQEALNQINNSIYYGFNKRVVKKYLFT